MERKLWVLVVLCAAAPVTAAPYYFQSASGQNAWIEVDAWAGSGANETILVVDWNFMGGPYHTESHAFGYRWDGTAYESDMLDAFHNAGVFTVTSAYGGAFLVNIAYFDGNDSHLHIEPGSWNLGSTDNPYARWGPMNSNWTKLGDWDANQAGYNQKLLQNGHLEGINAILWFGSYPPGTSIDDYPLNVPFAIPEPTAVLLLAAGLPGLRRRRS